MKNTLHDFEQILPLRGARSVKWETYAEDVLPMWVADADFACPEPVVAAVRARAELGVYGYPHVTSSFGKAVAHWQNTRFGNRVDPSHVVTLSAIVPGLTDAVKAFSEPEGKVLIQSPVYPPFHDVIARCGRVKVTSSLLETPDGWHIDFEDMERKLSDPDVSLFILCNPHNPVGRVFTRDELRRIGELCLRYNVTVLSDEIHCDLVYAGHQHTPYADLGPRCSAGSVTFVSTSKTFNTPGLRVAAAIIPNPDLRRRFEDEIEANKTAEPALFGLVALEAAYTHGAPYLEQLLTYLEGNIDEAFIGLRDIPGITAIRPQGTYLLWLDCRTLCRERLFSPDQLVRFMRDTAKVAMNNGEDFGPEGAGFLRMNLACRRDTVREAFRRIRAAVKS